MSWSGMPIMCRAAWIEQAAADIDLDANADLHSARRRITYDFLFFDTAIRCVSRAAIIGQWVRFT